MLPLIPPILALLLPPAFAFVLELSDSSAALVYSPSVVTPLAERAGETWVDWYTSMDGSPPPGPSDFVWPRYGSTHTTSRAGASVFIFFAGTRIEWWGRVGAGTVLSTNGEQVSPRPTRESISLAAADFELSVHNASLTLVNGNVTLTSVRITVPSTEKSWTSENALTEASGAVNPFFNAPLWETALSLAGNDWPSLRGHEVKGEAQWLNFSIPANTSLMVLNCASDPRVTTFDHFISPGGRLPRVNLQRSFAAPINATALFLDPAVKYEYALLPVSESLIKFKSVSFLTGDTPGLPVTATSGVPDAASAATNTDAGPEAAGAGVTEHSSPEAPPVAKTGNVGAIVGGVVGGLLALALLACGLWFFRQRLIQRRSHIGKRLDLNDSNISVTPYEMEDKLPALSLHPTLDHYPTPDVSPFPTLSTHESAGWHPSQFAPPLPIPAQAVAETVHIRTPPPARPAINTSLVTRPLSPTLASKRARLAPLSAGPLSAGHDPFSATFDTPDGSVIPSSASSLDSTDGREITVHATDAGPVLIDVLPPMYNPAWTGPGASERPNG
ncbi:hypothetical protein CC85DRAFT_301777 [Cutaneotrichosporon oleaginosum]|uniref:Uncharacterized protein n=1 Tax=Cutaneotrichosporon oleaginosum TaxID=879819 RepID=A0A0J0XPJ1_9TREE|nr:uncharacterized protein CC85DRAFT_301777 [Cutaneotrichosporon oleaginosum]KLT42992.1 hypothetical protein CC85DRAFT_301777 [Cutaneotrichosporon oleaginosum]TXT11800.1 hypothetical protein COLE_02210 [Cutaneotrichosporon oleaginosum]